MPITTSKDQPIGGSQSIVCPPGFDLVGSQCLPAASATAQASSPPANQTISGVFVLDGQTMQTTSINGELADDITTPEPLPKFEFPWLAAAVAIGVGLILGRK